MKRNIILFAIAMIAMIAFAGSAQALVEPVGGTVDKTDAEGQIITLWVNDRWWDNMTVPITDVPGYNDAYAFEDLTSVLTPAGVSTGSTYNLTVAMYCDGSNTYYNETGTHLYNIVYDGNPKYPPILNLEPCAVDEPDLIVSEISINPSYPSTGDPIFVNANNEICATVLNDGTGDVTGNFDVCFYDDANNVNMGSATVTGGLLAGQNTTVCIDWTPSCLDYPVSTAYPASGIPITLNVTADCNGAITETDETNNTLLMNTGVYLNGYKSKNFDCDATDPLTPFKYAGDQFTGGLVYNVSGTKDYPFDPSETQTRVHHIDLPSGATVKDARLYVVWYDYWGNPSPGVLANLSVDFTGSCGSATFTTPDAMYTDQKAFGSSNTPKGKYAYNVTSLVCNTPSNDYSVTVENIDPTKKTTLLGGILVVVYEGGEETIQLWWQEGIDYLMAADATHGSYNFGVSPEEATATVALPGSINLAIVDSANLITFVDQGMSPGSNLLFNGINIKTDAWDTPTEAYPDSKINVENVPVSVLASGNNMGFQDTGTGGMQADLAFLVLEKKDKVVVGIENGIIHSDPSSRTTLPITLNGISDYGTGTINLFYNPAIVDVTGVTGNADSAVSAWNKITEGHIKISAMNANGVSGDIVFANVEFAPTGLSAQCSDLNLTVDTLYDHTNIAPLEYTTQNGSICIYENEPPVVTVPTADPVVILNDNGRARVPDSNISTLSVYVRDDTGVSSVTVDLSPIKGPGYEAVAMSLDSGTDKNGVWKIPTNADYDPGVDSTHCLVVNATDVHGNSNTGVCITLTVLRRGDVVRDNVVNMGDALYIARYSVGLEPAPDEFVAGIVQADSFNGVDMGDALYIAKCTVGSEVAP